MKRSERFRWLGPKRYDVAGVRTFLGNKGYKGVVTYVEAVRQKEEDQLNKDIPDNSASSSSLNKKKAKDTSIHEQCSAECSTCDSAERLALEGDENGYLVAKALKGKFSVITGACTKCASRFTPQGLSPGAHLGDGFADLILVSKTSRLNYFRYLYRSAYLRSSPFDLPFVERLKVREFSFTPDRDQDQQKEDDGSKTSVWNCDGELLPDPTIQVKVS